MVADAWLAREAAPQHTALTPCFCRGSPMTRNTLRPASVACVVTMLVCTASFGVSPVAAQTVSPAIARSVGKTQKPPLHGQQWMAITGKPLAATAGAMMFHRGGNAVDAASAMLAATSTMWDVLSWGGETQALIYHPQLKKVIGINALGVAPS